MLWDRLVTSGPPPGFVTANQKQLLGLFWDKGQHWVAAAVRSLPIEEDGQGLVYLHTQRVTFHLQTLQRYLSIEPPPGWGTLMTYCFRLVHGLHYDTQFLFMEWSWLRVFFQELPVSYLDPTWDTVSSPHPRALILWEWGLLSGRACSGTVSVTLDVETANPWLEVSEDLKSLRWTVSRRSLPDTRKRFTNWDCPCALGSEGFTSGRHYWEVEVGGMWDWNLGIASESVERKRWVSLIPENGFWTMERDWGQFYINSSPRSPLPVGQIPRKVGVYLSYESGTVSFYNADTKSHLHTSIGNKFTGKLYPFFGTWGLNQFLRISC
ncbi:butyrophilin subfamily 1 member A1-like [Hemiscyllium ocellatum]|uniref:butyrophilin subfamily 1 member A1-like n=1 Tax=Hemiscyllium ocellatum TaxID=170820 RepID=UPI0029660390|nr:butyrophilin subfamily 1 member A1-like [Hemiscyllium ocellatum]